MAEIQLKLDDALQMAVQQQRAGNVSAAQYICRQILVIDPHQADALYLLDLMASDPDSAATQRQLATLIEQGDLEQAEAECWRAIELDPRNLQFQLELGNLHHLRNMPAAAIFVYSQTIHQSPEFAPPYNGRAVVLGEHMLLEEALVDHRKALELAPFNVEFHLEMAKTLGAMGDIAGAEASCRRGLELEPKSPAAWEYLGRAMQTNGRFEQAAAAFRRSLQIRSSPFVEMFLGMTVHRKEPNEMERLAITLNDSTLLTIDRVSAGFALGKMLDEADRFDEAFEAYTRANALFKELSIRRGQHFDIGAVRKRVDQMIDTFTPAFFQQRTSWGDRSEAPVFIVGMPRSGTSLVEQIAASHSKVFGAGERFDIAMIRSRLASMEGNSPNLWNESAMSQESHLHVQKLADLGGGAERVIDKMPGNIMELDLIAMLFPQARVIFCQRDPRDICLSCFFQFFGKNNQAFSYDLVDCARQLKVNERLTDHWRKVLPLRMLFVQYEELVADLEGQSRRLIEFLDLPWEPQCLNFYKTQRPILTKSVWQVRQPIYSRSVARWKNYEKHLAALQGELSDGRDLG